MSNDTKYKVVIIGEGRVGKTSLLVRYCKGEYSDKQESTINAFCLQKQIQVNETDKVNIAIWDTAGQEKYKALAPMFYQEAVCAIIVYDITFKESFDKVKMWVTELTKTLDTSQIILCIAGNKCDLEKDRQIDKYFAESYAYQVGACHFMTSAKNNKGINELFQYIGSEILKRNCIKGKKKKERLVINNQSFHEANRKKEEERDQGKSCC
ncbi:Rab-family small GTPase (macronuclear) [Tetrahymena thermophila SB210]|uniref:Rab-family small GTPase n=1 Tax=Tetrahymena thermophila (strain SB210) TaxID=312017 RepID=W7XLK1_TETTS|nr:Rab-family small GTPase [Tetrahymena thermophila SB210]EWS76429.1 Rab-family small GTPase [Tetrahymena thermophila SB210]|eukprot:XP_012651053.1 Rab-family small GTPase [Tetrahymena thermophila SB210]